MDNSLAGKFGFSANHVAGIMTNPLEGQLNTGEMMRALIQLAKARGIDYLTGATTESFEISNNQVQLVVSYGPNSMDKVQGVQSKSIPGTETIRLYARRLAVCTNAFANRLIPKLNVTPGRGQVLLTDEIPDLKFKGVFHYDQGYCYFRNIGSRVLFGGARNMDFESETTTEFGPNEQINDYLVHALSEVILPGTKFNVVSRWSGIMGFGEDKRPSIGLHSPEVGYAVRLGGMGVALGSLVGQRLAGLICLNPENS
jgi:glycine/D-amino acid oxidase-like deaminating enzyme